MSEQARTVNSRQLLERLSRQGSQGTDEIAVVMSPGTRTAAWAVKVKSNLSHNVYNVVAVIVSAPGLAPSEIGQQVKAVNLAESFTQQGTLSAGTFAVMSRVGDKNVFYAKP
ncbi:MAG: hypothetical protein ACYSWO_00745 [Planctomycetota bacterium]|jgi:hypothetical protein